MQGAVRFVGYLVTVEGDTCAEHPGAVGDPQRRQTERVLGEGRVREREQCEWEVGRRGATGRSEGELAEQAGVVDVEGQGRVDRGDGDRRHGGLGSAAKGAA